MGVLILQSIGIGQISRYHMDCKNCCKYHASCCSCWTGQDINWTNSFQNIPEFVPATSADWLSSAGKSTSVIKAGNSLKSNISMTFMSDKLMEQMDHL